MEFLTHVLTRIFLDKLLWHHILWKIFDLSFDWILLRDADAFLPYDGYVKIKPDRLASKEDTETLFLIVKYHTEVLFLFDPRRSTIKLHTMVITSISVELTLKAIPMILWYVAFRFISLRGELLKKHDLTLTYFT